MSKDSTRIFHFGKSETCKTMWTFTLGETDTGVIIKDIAIDAPAHDSVEDAGCKGHPKTIISLLRGRALDSIDVDALDGASCMKNHSCGQNLAHCLRLLRGR
ncbi:MAG: TSCPD domain-containing protein [Planctomycetota bacterium]